MPRALGRSVLVALFSGSCTRTCVGAACWWVATAACSSGIERPDIRLSGSIPYTVAAITEQELIADTPDELRALAAVLAAVLAARGVACMAGGKLVLFLANNASMVEGEIITMPRSLGNGIHGLESLEHMRGGAASADLARAKPCQPSRSSSRSSKRSGPGIRPRAVRAPASPTPPKGPISLTKPVCATRNVPSRQDDQGCACISQERHRHRAREVHC